MMSNWDYNILNDNDNAFYVRPVYDREKPPLEIPKTKIEKKLEEIKQK